MASNGFGDAASKIGKYDDLAGKRVLVTGGAAGIGRAVALAFAANGARVAVMGRLKERLEPIVEQCSQGGLVVIGTLSSVDDCRRAVVETISAFGGLDILINNGAPVNEEMIHDGGEDASDFQAAFQLHVGSAYVLIKAAEAELFKNKGSVVNVSSMASVTTPQTPQQAPYSVAKAAQDKMTQSLALQYAPHGVRVNSVQPAWVQTEAVEALADLSQMPVEKFIARAGALHPIGRVSTPEEQAALIVFLASAGAGFITGSCIHSDGGLSLKSIALPAWN